MIPPQLALLTKLPLAIYVLFGLMALLLGASAIYGEFAQAQVNVLIIYAVMYIGAIVSVGAASKSGKVKAAGKTAARAGMPIFLLAAVLSALIATMAYPFLKGAILASTLEAGMGMALAGGLLTAAVKAYIEEEVFRGQFLPLIGNLGQALLFGFFHVFILSSVLGWTLTLLGALAFLSILGYGWGWIKIHYGIGASAGSHFGYNLVAMGVSAFIFGAVVI